MTCFRIATCVLALGTLILSPLAASAAMLGVTVESSVRADLPLPGVDLTATGDVDWAVWGLSESPTVGDVTPDASKLGGTAIGPLTELNGSPVTDFSQFSFSPAFDWSDGTPTASGIAVAAAMTSLENGVGSGFSVDIAVDPSVREVVLYAQNFKSTGTFTASVDGMTVTESVISDTAGEFGDTGSIFTLDVLVDAPTTLSLSWEMTADLGLFENIGLSAISVGSVPEPTTAIFAIAALATTLTQRRRLV